jgi:hypothetical protein
VNGSNIVLRGTVLNLVPALAAGSTFSKSTDEGVITVTVEEYPDITTTVDPVDGSFILRGLPEESFTLVFTGEHDADLGSLTFEAVKPNQELIVSVELMNGAMVLVEEQRNGIGHAGLEIQGSLDYVLMLDAGADSEFMIAGYQVVARPGVTAIRENNTGLTVEELALLVGAQVHVKGLWLELEPGVDRADQKVLAYSIVLQDGDADGEKETICHKEKNTLSVGVGAVPAHLAHGDAIGACPS